MKLIRYNPIENTAWSPLDRLSSLRDLFDSAFALASSAPAWQREWAPALDVLEDDQNIRVDLELAGMKKDDFDISLENDVLTISGERRQEDQAGEGESFRRERFFGRFTRSITLPVPVKADQVSAKYQDGVLHITLPKSEEAKPKKIAVELS
jgi:HSP20 family protein